MQYNQPIYTYIQPNVLSPTQFNPLWPTQFPYPTIIGESEVSSMVLPDGTIQYYFMPNPGHRWILNTNGNWTMGNLPWPDRSIPNSYATVNPSQQTSHSPDNTYMPFPLKFHNDNWTSTTDLQYFYPQIQRDWMTLIPPSKIGACVQVETSDFLFSRPVSCHQSDFLALSENQPRTGCICSGGLNHHSAMSVSEIPNQLITKSQKMSTKDSINTKVQTDSSDVCKCHFKRSNKKKKSKTECYCFKNEPFDDNSEHVDKLSSTNKDISLTTYIDQCTGCIPQERNTQTCETITSNHDLCEYTTELWIPKIFSNCKIPKM